ncbi:MAG: chloride channel protein [Acidimicrobiia bacterium]
MERRSLARVLLDTVILGLFSGAFGLAYLWLVEKGTHALWGEVDSYRWFSGGWPSVVIPITAGLITGALYRGLRVPPRFKGFIQDLEEGEVEPRTAPGALLIALVSLLGGASLGPEAPLGTAGGAAGTWWARRGGAGDDDVRTATFTGISAVFGGLLSTPLGGPLLAFELEHEQSNTYYTRHLVPGVIAGAIGFGLMWPVIGTPFVGLYDFDRVDFRPWMILAGVGIGAGGALVALLIGKAMTTTVGVMRRLDDRPVLRGLIAGCVVAVLAYAMPLTLFSGASGLEPVFSEPANLGVALLLTLALLKTVALAASLGGGFFGGPIFPTFFIGGTIGAAVHLIFPGLPLAITVGSTMAALGGAIALVPVSMAVLGTLIIQGGILESSVVVVAAVTAFAVRSIIAPPPPRRGGERNPLAEVA